MDIAHCATSQCQDPIPQATRGGHWQPHYQYSFRCHREIPWNCPLIRFPWWYLLNISIADGGINHQTCPRAGVHKKNCHNLELRKNGATMCLLCWECAVGARETMIWVVLVSSVSTPASLQKLINMLDCTFASFETLKIAGFSLFTPNSSDLGL